MLVVTGLVLPFNIDLIVFELVSSAPLTTATIWAELGPAQLQLVYKFLSKS